MKYVECTSVAEHLSRFQNCVNRLLAMKIIMDDELQALLLLSLLPDSWEILVVSLSNSASDNLLTLGLVNDSMLNEELKHKELGGSNGSNALVRKSW